MLKVHGCLAGGALPEANCKPLVIVIENTEAADLSTLQDLILVLSEVICSPCLMDPY